MRKTCASKVCPLGILMSKWWFIGMQVQTGGVISECGCLNFDKSD